MSSIEPGLALAAPPVDDGCDPARRSLIATYRRYAPLYDLLFGRVLDPGRRALARTVALHGAGAVLEVGVGTGLMLESYPPSSSVTGIDLSPHMLAIAGERAGHLPDRNIALFAMDAENMDFPDDSFDCVTLPYVLSVTPDPARLVHEVRRVCRPGGTIVILNHFSGSRFWWAMERLVSPVANRVGFRSDFGLREHVLAYDWTVQSIEPVNLLGLSRLVVLRNG